MILIPLNGLDTTCSEGWHCSEDQVCDEMNCVPCEEGLEPDESQLNCISSMFYHFFYQQPSKTIL